MTLHSSSAGYQSDGRVVLNLIRGNQKSGFFHDHSLVELTHLQGAGTVAYKNVSQKPANLLRRSEFNEKLRRNHLPANLRRSLGSD